MVRNCKTCKEGILTNEKAFSCVSCKSQMNMTPESTALSTTAMNGTKEIGLNAMLLRNAFVENNKQQ